MALEAATYIDELINTNPPGGDQASTIDEHLRLIKAVLLNSFANISGAVTASEVDLNKLTGYTGALPELSAVQVWTGQQYFGEATLTDAVNIAWNLDTAQTGKVTLAGNRTLTAPTNMKAGATYLLRILQDATGSRTMTFNAAYEFPSGVAPTLTTTGSATDILSCYSDGVAMYCNTLLDVS